MKIASALFATYLSLSPAIADNEDFSYRLMLSNIETQLENEGFDPPAIDLVKLVARSSANQTICGFGAMKDDVIIYAAKQRRLPLPLLMKKARQYMDLEVSRIRAIFREIDYCRRLQKIENG